MPQTSNIQHHDALRGAGTLLDAAQEVLSQSVSEARNEHIRKLLKSAVGLLSTIPDVEKPDPQPGFASIPLENGDLRIVTKDPTAFAKPPTPVRQALARLCYLSGLLAYQSRTADYGLELAAEFFSQAWEHDHTRPEYHVMWGRCEAAVGHFGNARTGAEWALHYDPASVEAAQLLASAEKSIANLKVTPSRQSP
jgi:hypothetical protein